MITAYIAVGSNLGDRLENLKQAHELLQREQNVSILRQSVLYETDPVGGPAGQGKFYNGVWELETTLVARELLVLLQKIEKMLGRERTVKNGPRTVDLDILFYGNEIIEEPGLQVPHPKLHERTFVLRPLADLAPHVRHPILQKSVQSLLESLSENLQKS